MSSSSDALDARVRFLHSAARQYATASPATSAFLLSQARMDERLEASQAAVKSCIRLCKSCASPQLPGWNSQVTMVATKKRRKPKGSRGVVPEDKTSSARFSCNVCRQTTEHTLPKPPAPRKAVVTPVSVPKSSSSRQADRKKRKKTGLQALVAQGTSSSRRTAGSFTFGDLMQKPAP